MEVTSLLAIGASALVQIRGLVLQRTYITSDYRHTTSVMRHAAGLTKPALLGQRSLVMTAATPPYSQPLPTRVCSLGIRWSSSSSSPTLAHVSWSCRMYSLKMGLASYRIVVLCSHGFLCPLLSFWARP